MPEATFGVPDIYKGKQSGSYKWNNQYLLTWELEGDKLTIRSSDPRLSERWIRDYGKSGFDYEALVKDPDKLRAELARQKNLPEEGAGFGKAFEGVKKIGETLLELDRLSKLPFTLGAGAIVPSIGITLPEPPIERFLPEIKLPVRPPRPQPPVTIAAERRGPPIPRFLEEQLSQIPQPRLAKRPVAGASYTPSGSETELFIRF